MLVETVFGPLSLPTVAVTSMVSGEVNEIAEVAPSAFDS